MARKKPRKRRESTPVPAEESSGESRNTPQSSTEAQGEQPESQKSKIFPIVGIGASVGGLAALKKFFSRASEESGMAFVVVVHLSPDHKSHLAELLQPHIKMPVRQVTETIQLERNHVYVIPPNANLDTIDTHLRLTKLERRRQEPAPIDHFFRTLSRTHDGEAIGVILTGTGSDGTLGLREIKERGGLTVVQEPREAEYDGMPKSAIATGLVDLVLPLEEIFDAICRYVKPPPQLLDVSRKDATSKEELQSMNEELQTVNQENRHKVEELAQLSSDLQNLLAASDIATLFLDRELRILWFTPKVDELFNVRMTDRGRLISGLTHRLGYELLQDDAKRVLDRLIPVEREVKNHTGNWFLTRVMPYRSAEDRIEGVVITFIDITQRKKAELEAQAARQYAEQIIETLPEPLLVLDAELTVISGNPAYFRHFQARRSRTEGHPLFELAGGQWNVPAFRELLEEVVRGHHTFDDFQIEIPFEELGRRVLLLSGRRLPELQLILLGIRDITERHKAEQALRESETRLKRMFNVEGLGVLIFNQKGTLIKANDTFIQMFGYSHDQIRSGQLTWRRLTPVEYVDESDRQMQKLRETGRIGPYEKEYVREDASRSWMVFIGADLGDGTIVKYCIDVNDRKQAESALRASEERYKTLFQSLDEGFCVVEALLDESGACVDCRLVEANTAFNSQMAIDQPADHQLRQLVPDLDPFWCETIGRVARTSLPERFHASLHQRFYDVFAFSIGQPEQKHVAILLNDVTKRVEIEHSLQDTNKQLEKQVSDRTGELEQQNQRLRQLARQLAETEQRERSALAKTLHDGLQQLLVAVKMQIRSCFESGGEQDVRNLEGLLDEAIDASRSLSYELSPPTLQNSDLPEALRWLAEWFKTNHKFELELDAPEDFPQLERHIRAFLFFAIRELLLNAVKHSGTNRARVALTSTDTREISVQVSDQGKGFDPDVQQNGAKLYGFGLFSIQERISALGGRVDVKSIPGNGADVRLYYPIKTDG